MNNFVANVPIDDAKLYDQNYFRQNYERDPQRDAMYLQEHARIVERVEFGNVLDIGCGVGNFLSVFDDRWNKYGFEPSDYAAERAASKGIKMFRNYNCADTESMDVVIMRGVLQHMNKPIETLFHAWRILRKGGLLVILATPDSEGIVYKLWRNLPPLDAPRNWIVFGAGMLVNILQRLEFTKIEVLHPYWGTPYARPVRDFVNFFLSLFFGWRKFAFPGNMMEIYAWKK